MAPASALIESRSSARMARSAIQYTVIPSNSAETANSPISSAESLELSLLKRLGPANEHVPRSADGTDIFRRRTVTQLGSKAADMAFDHAGVRIKMDLPNMLEQHAACHHAAGIAHQIFEQFEFLG